MVLHASARALLARYLPGGIWYAAGRGALLRHHGISAPASATAGGLELALGAPVAVVVGTVLLAAAGEPEIKQKLLDGYQVGSKTFRIHLDGYNMLDYWTGKTDKSPRKEFFYFSDDGDLTALRYGDWKAIFLEQRAEDGIQAWREPFVPLRVPLLFNLRRDPFERAQKTSNTYDDWFLDRVYLLVPAQAYVGRFLETFKDYPPRMKAASFGIDQVMERLQESLGASN